MTTYSRSQMLDRVHQVLASQGYKDRLGAIHKHYPNVKSEGRYRDALLELFNDEQERIGSGLRAYAEAERFDLVVTQAGQDKQGWLRIEMKYHFTFDFAHRVNSQLKRHGIDMRAAADNRGDLGKIARDCIYGEESERCDAFILIVQDRHGAAYHDKIAPVSVRKKRQSYPVFYERGVTIQFLHEQMKLVQIAGNRYHEAWQTPLYEMLQAIHQVRRYSLRPTLSHKLPLSLGIPLTSHIFTLDFLTLDCALPNIREIFRLGNDTRATTIVEFRPDVPPGP